MSMLTIHREYEPTARGWNRHVQIVLFSRREFSSKSFPNDRYFLFLSSSLSLSQNPIRIGTYVRGKTRQSVDVVEPSIHRAMYHIIIYYYYLISLSPSSHRIVSYRSIVTFGVIKTKCNRRASISGESGTVVSESSWRLILERERERERTTINPSTR